MLHIITSTGDKLFALMEMEMDQDNLCMKF